MSNHLNLTTLTRICIWNCDGQALQCEKLYGRFGNQQGRIIDVLKWNGGVSTHFDLLVPVEASEQDYSRSGVEVNDELRDLFVL